MKSVKKKKITPITPLDTSLTKKYGNETFSEIRKKLGKKTKK